jgi:hypothetical protein
MLYTRGKDTRYPLDRKLGWPELVSTQRLEERSFASAGDRTPVVQSVVKHYTQNRAKGGLYYFCLSTKFGMILQIIKLASDGEIIGGLWTDSRR